MQSWWLVRIEEEDNERYATSSCVQPFSLSLSPRERNKDNTERSLSEGCGINFRGKRFVSFSLSLFLSLKHLPESNATWSNDTIQLLPNIDVGVAVAVEGGLITPIINNANRLSVYDISIKIKVVDPIWWILSFMVVGHLVGVSW